MTSSVSAVRSVAILLVLGAVPGALWAGGYLPPPESPKAPVQGAADPGLVEAEWRDRVEAICGWERKRVRNSSSLPTNRAPSADVPLASPLPISSMISWVRPESTARQSGLSRSWRNSTWRCRPIRGCARTLCSFPCRTRTTPDHRPHGWSTTTQASRRRGGASRSLTRLGTFFSTANRWRQPPAGGGGRKRRERDVKRFAADLLMPRQFVLQAASEYGPDPERLRALFQVSRQAMEIRLRELGLGKNGHLGAAASAS
jgi:hypothetical protein